MFLIPPICLIITIILWNIFGKSNKVIETVEFYPPNEINSLEAGFLYKGKIDYRDIISLLIYLENLGYIKMEETQEKTEDLRHIISKIIKVKEYDGDNAILDLFM